MQVVDLTHFLSQGMPVYPGTEGPRFESANTYERDGFQETRMTMYTHTGTHVDPPAHLFPGGATLDRLPITQFVGTALVIDCTDLREGGRIAMDRVERRRADADMAEFLLFRTGWDRYWGDPRYFGAYPCIGGDVAEYLVQSRKRGSASTPSAWTLLRRRPFPFIRRCWRTMPLSSSKISRICTLWDTASSLSAPCLSSM